MKTELDKILFTLEYMAKDYPVQTSKNEYYSLMTLISDYLSIPGFGLCSGMGSCGTCTIELLSKHVNVKKSMLSCGIAVNDSLANSRIIIPKR